MGSVRLYFARDSPCDENKQPCHTGSVATRVNKDRAYDASPKIRGRDSITIDTWNTRKVRAAGKLQELTHEMDRYRRNILGL